MSVVAGSLKKKNKSAWIARMAMYRKRESENITRSKRLRSWSFDCPFVVPRLMVIFFFQAEDGIRDYKVTGVQTVLFRSLSGIPLALKDIIDTAGIRTTAASALF